MTRAHLLILASSLLVACGSRATSPPAEPCPAAAPSSGSACSPEKRVCDYVGVPRAKCVTGFVCQGGEWVAGTPSCFTGPPAADCPESLASARQASCSVSGTGCYYDGAVCTCSDCSKNQYPIAQCGQPLHFNCGGSEEPGCPPAFLRGGSCESENKECLYADACEDSTALVCRDGSWVPVHHQGTGCPVSVRAAKKNIHYLGPAELRALASELRRTRLATYQYRNPALGEKQRLGFILDDQPLSYASDPAHSCVDLDGYMSLLVATLKVQEQELAELRAQLSALKKQRPPRRR